MKTFVVPGVLHHKATRHRRPKPQQVSLFIEAEDREDALFQAYHGVIEATVSKSFPEAKVKYDLRKLKLHG